MDIREASAMTEASGLVDDGKVEEVSAAMSGTAAEVGRRPLYLPSADAAIPWARSVA